MSFQITGIKFKDAKEEIGLTDTLLSQTVHNLCITFESSNIKDSPSPEAHNPSETSDTDDDSMNDSESSNMGEYDLYSRVEFHMRMSMSLYMLNRQGQDLVKEVESKKVVTNKRRNQNVRRGMFADESMSIIYGCLHAIINFNRMNIDMYVELLNLLDEELFNECGELESFFVKDDEYKLESMYYKQDSWVSGIEWETPQVFQFTTGDKLDTCECTHLLMYCMKYRTLLDEINACFDNSHLECLVGKLHEKLKTAIDLLQVQLKEYLSDGNSLSEYSNPVIIGLN